MPIEHVLAVVPVADLEAASGWYERLLGRPADNRPMDSLVEWQVTDTGWVQVFLDGPGRHRDAQLRRGRPGQARRRASSRGLAPGAIKTVNKGVQLSTIADPDGNQITFIGNFRIKY